MSTATILPWRAVPCVALAPAISAGEARLDTHLEASLDAQILVDIAPYYGELERGFATTHLPRVGASLPSIGFSTVAKLAWSITANGRVIGKAIGTLKRGGAMKIGPIMVLPEARARGHATAFLEATIGLARRHGLTRVFATVPTANRSARRMFDRAGFRQVGVLVDHYRRCGSEEVVAFDCGHEPTRHTPTAPTRPLGAARERVRGYVVEQFFPVDPAWDGWLANTTGPELGQFDHKPHDLVEDHQGGLALIIYKRGGTAKVVPVVDGSPPSLTLTRACEQMGVHRERRKLAMFLPSAVQGPAGYRRELEAVGYSCRGPISVWSRALE